MNLEDMDLNPGEMQLKSIKFLAIGISILAAFAVMYVQNNKIDSLKKDIQIAKGITDQYSQALDYQNSAIVHNMQDQNKTAALPKVLEKIKTRYVYTQNDIIQWRDKNETHDCNSSIMFIDAFNYDFDGMR